MGVDPYFIFAEIAFNTITDYVTPYVAGGHRLVLTAVRFGRHSRYYKLIADWYRVPELVDGGGPVAAENLSSLAKPKTIGIFENGCFVGGQKILIDLSRDDSIAI